MAGLIFSTRVYSQTAPVTTAPAEPVLKVCKAENPPPCADTPPKPTYSPSAEYTAEARDKKIQGTVVLSVIIGEDGKVKRVSVTHGLGGGLDEQAMKAVSNWRFKPAKANRRPVSVEIRVECRFGLFS